ncbi:RagB/SusD family nutrient uptake outer membrane protein [Hoylesella shahii]|uniref:RagB/SusD family nutrient uptake outer membrane protein n=1 Tax=Hoylesella shahii TaxID=228603 RepID=UPI0028EAA131|nr:RagB/SusD family nutrient uptake outer membrane protein [Hoylesella shahii]
MKNLKSYICLLCTAALVFSCNDILETSSTKILTNEKVWSSKDAIDAYLGQLYDEMQVEDFEYQPGTDGQYLSTLTDEAVRAYTWGSANQQLIPEGIYGWWGYVQIRNINLFLESIGTASMLTESQRKMYEAEARFCRAFGYFAMVKRYGGVPLVTKVQKLEGQDVETLRLPRNKEYEIYDFIKAECQAIESLLPEKRTDNEQYRATRYAVNALECRAMLYAATEAKYGNVQLDGLVGIPADKAEGYFKDAKAAAKKIIDSGKFALYSAKSDKAENFQYLFLDETSANTEQIFTKAFDASDKGNSFDYFNAPQSFKLDYGCVTNPTADFVADFEYVDGSDGALKVKDGSGNPIKYNDPTDLFKDKDPRMLGSILYPFCPWQGGKVEVRKGIVKPDGTVVTASSLGDKYEGTNVTIAAKDGTLTSTDVTKTGFYIKKFMTPNKVVDWGKGEANWMVFRYGEVLLNFAEACVELGDNAEALAAVNQLRNRAGIAPRTSINRDQVRHERRVELAFENHRWWDIRRWHIADQLLNATQFKALNPYLVWEDGKKVEQMKYIFKIEDAPKNTRTFLPKLYYERIPAEAISTNPNITQNPGY